MKNDLPALWEEMHRLTREIHQLIQTEQYEQLEKVVDQREKVIEQLQKQPEDKGPGNLQELIAKVQELDAEALRAAREAKENLEKKIQALQHSRRAIQGYEHDLSFTPQPIFFDRKK